MSGTKQNDDLAIRAKPRPVRRFNRGVLMATAAGAGLLILGAAGFALRSPENSGRSAQTELYNTSNKPMPDAFSALPSTYGEVAPTLGPPLPGDLGAAYLNVNREERLPDNAFRFEPAAASSSTGPPSEPSEARTSGLFFINKSDRLADSTASSGAPFSQSNTLDQLAALIPPAGAYGDNPFGYNSDPYGQLRKEAFLTGDIDEAIYNPHQLQTPVSPYQVMAGTIIPASLITGINSDLPGQVIAQVTEHIYDTATGAHLLIPQGTRLIGRYDSVIAHGQSRALVVWTRALMPDGSSITLQNLPGVDLGGRAGLKDRVNHHGLQIFGAAILSSVLSVASEIGRDSNDDAIIEALRDGGQRTINQAGQQFVTRQLNVQPTITVRPGWRLRVIVNKDLVLKSYGA